MADFEDLREFERIEAEESWQEVGKKKATPKKGGEDKKSNGNKRENSKTNAGKERRNPSRECKKDMASDVKKEKASEKPKEQVVANNATANATPTKAPLSSEAKPTIINSTPSKDTEATIPSSDSAVKRGYSSIVSAMAAKDPTAPIHTSTAAIHSQIFLSPYEFCMKCHDPTLYQEPLPTPLTTRGLINPKNDCFQNCILQALFALPSIRKLSYAFHDPSIVLDANLPLWTEFITFGRQFLVNPIDLNNPSLSDYSMSSSTVNRRQRGSAMNKDCILASNSMPCLCSSFDTLVHREQSHDSVSQSVSLLSSAVEKLQLNTPSTTPSTAPFEAPIPLKRQRSLEKPNLAQQDAMEFLTFLLDALHEEARHMLIASDPETTQNQRAMFASFLESLPAYRQTMRQLQSATVTPETPDDDHDTWSTVPTRHSNTIQVKHVQVDAASKQQAMSDLFSSSVIPRLFHGLLRSEVTYKTKKTCSITFQKFHCLTLNLRSPTAPAVPASIGKGKSAVDAGIPLQEALKTYFAEERLENENMRKQTRFEVLPETLILHVGRFSFDYRLNQPVKMHQRLDYPLILTIPRDCLSNSLCLNQQEGVSYTYRLHALVLHHGKKATGGHYTTYACEEALPIDGYDDGYKWRNIDDNRVTEISEEQALDAGSTVYLLFYVRMDRLEN